MRNIFIILLLFVHLVSFGQDKTKAKTTLSHKPANNKSSNNKEEKNKHLLRLNYSTLFRVGIGAQKSMFTEIGVTRSAGKSLHRFTQLSYYSALEWAPAFYPEERKSVYGLKIGCTLRTKFIIYGLETKYLTDKNLHDFVITPKLGIAFKFVNLFYGWNFTTNHFPFPRIKWSQFSLVVNIGKYSFYTKNSPKIY